MYIEPNTNIRILRGVPLENNYEHTIHFTSASAQTSYFIGKQKYNLTNQTYQRVNRGIARIGISSDNLYDCNYMMFQNTSFGSKWFYAFLTSVEYVNNECAEIVFEIDVMQTWYLDVAPTQCYCERHHTVSDKIGEHIEPENVAIGEYVMNGYSNLFNITSLSTIVAIVDVDSVDGKIYDGIYGSAKLFAYTSSETDLLNAKIQEYSQSPDSVLSVYMCPTAFVPSLLDDHSIRSSSSGRTYNINLPKPNANTSIGNYLPRNCKLYTYPYTYLHVDNASSGSLALRYEMFSGNNANLRLDTTITQPIYGLLKPFGYKGTNPSGGISGGDTLNTESLQITNFPMCSWNFDAYQTWLAQNSVPIALNTVSNLGQTAVASNFSAIPLGTMTSGILGSVSSIVGQSYGASIQADISKGSLNNGCVNSANSYNQFYGARCTITEQYARRIDDYFDLFGYAIGRIRTPDRNIRPYWTYIKTSGCILSGSINAQDERKICDIYDKGITIWNNGDNVGNYSLDNRATSRG